MNKLDIYIIIGSIIAMYAAAAWKDKLPSAGAVHQLIDMLDSKGGNILILAGLALYFFHRTEEMYYAFSKLVVENKIASDNGTALNGLLFCNGAFSGVSGALLKVMSGGNEQQKALATPATPAASETPGQ